MFSHCTNLPIHQYTKSITNKSKTSVGRVRLIFRRALAWFTINICNENCRSDFVFGGGGGEGTEQCHIKIEIFLGIAQKDYPPGPWSNTLESDIISTLHLCSYHECILLKLQPTVKEWFIFPFVNSLSPGRLKVGHSQWRN